MRIMLEAKATRRLHTRFAADVEVVRAGSHASGDDGFAKVAERSHAVQDYSSRLRHCPQRRLIGHVRHEHLQHGAAVDESQLPRSSNALQARHIGWLATYLPTRTQNVLKRNMQCMIVAQMQCSARRVYLYVVLQPSTRILQSRTLTSASMRSRCSTARSLASLRPATANVRGGCSSCDAEATSAMTRCPVTPEPPKTTRSYFGDIAYSWAMFCHRPQSVQTVDRESAICT